MIVVVFVVVAAVLWCFCWLFIHAIAFWTIFTIERCDTYTILNADMVIDVDVKEANSTSGCVKVKMIGREYEARARVDPIIIIILMMD